jgi:type II restriction enzyme
MRYLDFYNQTLNCHNADEVFEYFIKNLKPSILLWNYFVNWDKVFQNTKKIEVALNNLNYLIGKEDFDNEFKYLLKENPKLAKVIPSLVVRDGSSSTKFKILIDYTNKKFVYEDYDFSISIPTEADIETYLTFVKESGLKALITSQKIKNLVDYMIGVEAGLDSNGRKNRGGQSMEAIIDWFIKDHCNKNGYEYLKEANATKIYEKWQINVPVDKSSRRYDFIMNNGKELVIFETNFYGGGGSKLKATAGEYRSLFDKLDNQFKFVWITDGAGWFTTAKPLRETFNHNDYIFNLAMLEQGILDVI